MMKTIFMGSPDFALPVLTALVEQYQVCGVVTQPDRPSGRGRQLTAPPVKVEAQRLHLPVIQPQKLREPGVLDVLRVWGADFIVVAAYGQILRQDVLDLPQFGCINVHASLLPRWRGAAPIQAAILAGDPQTGITIMKMDAGLDSGPILSQEAVAIEPDDTAGTLSDKLAALGARLLIQTLPGYLDGSIRARPQDESLVTKAPLLTKEQGMLDFGKEARVLERQVRAFSPWPGCYTTWREQILKVHRAHTDPGPSGQPGSRRISSGKPAWCTAVGLLVADELQPAGKKKMTGEEFIRGNRDWLS